MSRSWREIDFESVRNQAALVCNCRHGDLHGLLEVEFAGVLDGLQNSGEPVRDIIVWADQVCERLIGVHTSVGGGRGSCHDELEEFAHSMGIVTSQIMRDLVSK